MFQTCSNSQLLRRVLWLSAEQTIGASLKHKNTQPLSIFYRENPQNSEPKNGPRSGLDYIALAFLADFQVGSPQEFRLEFLKKYLPHELHTNPKFFYNYRATLNNYSAQNGADVVDIWLLVVKTARYAFMSQLENRGLTQYPKVGKLCPKKGQESLGYSTDST